MAMVKLYLTRWWLCYLRLIKINQVCLLKACISKVCLPKICNIQVCLIKIWLINKWCNRKIRDGKSLWCLLLCHKLLLISKFITAQNSLVIYATRCKMVRLIKDNVAIAIAISAWRELLEVKFGWNECNLNVELLTAKINSLRLKSKNASIYNLTMIIVNT